MLQWELFLNNDDCFWSQKLEPKPLLRVKQGHGKSSRDIQYHVIEPSTYTHLYTCIRTDNTNQQRLYPTRTLASKRSFKVSSTENILPILLLGNQGGPLSTYNFPIRHTSRSYCIKLQSYHWVYNRPVKVPASVMWASWAHSRDHPKVKSFNLIALELAKVGLVFSLQAVYH